MIKKYLVVAALALSASVFPAVVFAGEHVWGVWSTDHDKAMKSAFMLAESKVKTRDKGCVGRGKDDNKTEELKLEEKGDKVRYGVFISHHNGSCRIKKSILENMSRETGIDVNRIIQAWAGN